MPPAFGVGQTFMRIGFADAVEALGGVEIELMALNLVIQI